MFDPKYMLIIFITSNLFMVIGVLGAIILEKTMPPFDDDKHKIRIVCEIFIRIGSIGILTYIFRYIIDSGLNRVMDTSKYGEPGKYASLVIAPTMFMAQQNLLKKIIFITEFIISKIKIPHYK